MLRNSCKKALVGSAAVFGSLTLMTSPAMAHTGSLSFQASLNELNGSGASGTATATVRNQTIEQIGVSVRGLNADGPHAQHIHYGEEARNECPTLFDDDENNDRLLSTVEGVPAYGPIAVSLTTSGGTTPADGLAVTRFPVSVDGSYDYNRNNLRFTSVDGAGVGGTKGSAKDIADAIRDGEGVVVIHGVDYNGNGTYDGTAMSELDPTLPREATDPAACGILVPTAAVVSVGQAVENLEIGVTAAGAALATSVARAVDAVEGKAGVSAFEARVGGIVASHEASLTAAFNKLDSDLANGHQTAVARDQFVNAYQAANARALNELHQAKDALSDALNRANAGESKDTFNNRFNVATAELSSRLEMAKNEFNDAVNNSHNG